MNLIVFIRLIIFNRFESFQSSYNRFKRHLICSNRSDCPNQSIRHAVGDRFKIGLIVGQFILISLLLLLMSKGTIIALIIAFLAPFIFRKKVSKKIIFGSAIIVILVFILLPKHNNRFVELLKKGSFEKIDMNNLLKGFKLVSDYLEKSILKPNNLILSSILLK